MNCIRCVHIRCSTLIAHRLTLCLSHSLSLARNFIVCIVVRTALPQNCTRAFSLLLSISNWYYRVCSTDCADDLNEAHTHTRFHTCQMYYAILFVPFNPIVSSSHTKRYISIRAVDERRPFNRKQENLWLPDNATYARKLHKRKLQFHFAAGAFRFSFRFADKIIIIMLAFEANQVQFYWMEISDGKKTFCLAQLSHKQTQNEHVEMCVCFFPFLFRFVDRKRLPCGKYKKN